MFVILFMVRLLTLEDKIRYRIKKGKSSIFLLKDFVDITDRDQAGKILRKLIKDNLLVKLGYGVYSRAKISDLTGNVIPEKGLINGGKEFLEKKMGIKTYPTKYEKMYNNYQSTQIPTGRVIAVNSRITRKIFFDGVSLKYERVGAKY